MNPYILLIILLCMMVIGHYIIAQAEKPEKEKRKQKFKEFEDNYYKEHNKNESDVYLFDSCKYCVFFDGYDVCCHEENFGSEQLFECLHEFCERQNFHTSGNVKHFFMNEKNINC